MNRKIYILVLVIFSLLLSVIGPVSGQSTVQTPYIGMWISAWELESLPMSGAAWTSMLAAANGSAGSPNIKDQENQNDVLVLAKALVYARTGDTKYRGEVISNLKAAINTENGGRTLALGRNLVSYVIAADLVNLPLNDPVFHTTFSNWLRAVRSETLDGRTLISTHEDRPNNWGTHAGASRAAVAIYLEDEVDLARTALVFSGFLGDRSKYSEFNYGDLDWQCDQSSPVGINPDGCTVQGVDIGGSLPEEMRRAGSFTNPPLETGYAWEAMQGILVQSLLLHRAGFKPFQWSDEAILRAVEYLIRVGWQPEGDDVTSMLLVNYIFDTNYFEDIPTIPAKNIGWTDWTHGTHDLMDVEGGSISTPNVTVTTAPATATVIAPFTATVIAPVTATPTVLVTNTPIAATTEAPSALTFCLEVIMTDPPTSSVVPCNN